MEIVRGDLSRLDDLEPLFLAMHRHHQAGNPQASEVVGFRSDAEAWRRRRGHYAGLLASARGHLLLAEDGGRVIGYAMVSEASGQATLATDERMAELESLSVLEDARGQGVGRALMDAAYAVIRELGIGELMLYVMDGNDGALRFYERLGLRPYLHVMLGRVPPG